MRLESRLKNLEAFEPSVGLTRHEKTLIVNLLGRIDAMFWPWRFQTNSNIPFAEIYRRQREYLDGSNGLKVKADGQRNWKQSHEIRQKLIAANFISASFSGGQVQSVFLTELGRPTAMALAGPGLSTLNDLETLALRETLRRDGGTVRESKLFGLECVGDPSDWNRYTQFALPLLTGGLAACHSDSQGRACYKLVSKELPEIIQVNVPFEAAMGDEYIRAFNQERLNLEGCTPRDPHELFIPIPSSGWGE